MRSPTVLTGRRVSRRAFLQAAATSGIAAVGAAGVTSAAFRSGEPVRDATSDQLLEGPIAELAAALAYDLGSIFRFVADGIRYEPYSGVLRGAEGTLAARAGNSVDQALLLGALLDASLVTYRFAVGELDAAAAAALQAATQSNSEDVAASFVHAIAGIVPGASTPAPPPLDADTQALVDAGAGNQDRVAAWARDQLATTMADIDATLASAGIELPSGISGIPEREVDQHVWIQISQGTDWLDLDPSVPGTPSGQRLASAGEPLDALPDDLFHRVELSVIAENIAPTGLTTATLLKVSERADRLAGWPITFLNADPTGVARLAQVVTPIAGVISYLPTLVIGDEAFAGSPIRFGRPEGEAEGLLGGSEGILGGSAGGETTAEWLEISIFSPDRDPVIVRRAIFDRFGPAARAAGELDPTGLAPVATMTLVEGSSPSVLPAQAATWIAIGVGLPDRDAPVTRQTHADTGALAAIAHTQHVVRELGDLVLALPMGARSYVDAPNVSAYTINPRLAEGGEPMIDFAMDIWHRSRGVVPVVGESLSAPPATVAGVIDHVMERLLMGDAVGASPDAGASPGSVGAVFDRAREQGIGFRALTDPTAIADLEYHPDAAALLAADLADGWVAVVPEHPVLLGDRERAGWWLIDVASGRAADRLDDGRGAQGIEYQATLTPAQLAALAAREAARNCLRGGGALLAVAISSVLAGVALVMLEETQNQAWFALSAVGGAGMGGGLQQSLPLLACLRAA